MRIEWSKSLFPGGTPTNFEDHLLSAYQYFNKYIFDGKLPNRVPLSVEPPEAYDKSSWHGLFKPSTNEIWICSNAVENRTLLKNLSTLAHEMCHLEIRLTYSDTETHGIEWQQAVRRIGLEPVPLDDGHSTHKVVPGSLFDVAATSLMDGGDIYEHRSVDLENRAKMGFAMPTGGRVRNAHWADSDYIADKYFFQPGDIWIGRNPHNSDDAIGYRDEKHIMVCAGAGSGKGRSFIVNNLALYPGSTITYDPKGELPDILAPRRGDGDAFCEGMEQGVFVLDPLNRSGVETKYRAYCDPISMIDPDIEDLPTWCNRLARSLVKKKEGGQAQDWADKGVAYIALVIEYVVTAPLAQLPNRDRSIHTVYELVTQGCVAAAEAMTEAYAAHAEEENAKGNGPISPKDFDPYDVLLDRIINNPNGNRFIAMKARKLKRDAQKVEKYFVYVSGEASEGMGWLANASIERVMSGVGMDESRRFDPNRLKTDPKGISVFIVMPVDDLDEYEPWLQSLFVGIFAAMRAQKIKPKYPILTILDEFSSLGYQDYIAKSLDNIRGAGMKLVFILQDYGTLKELYGHKMDSFFTNSGLELYFGRIGRIASDYLKDELGETEVVRIARSMNQSETETETSSTAIAFGHTTSETNTETRGDSKSRGTSRQWNWSTNVAHSDSSNWGESRGNTSGSNYGPHVFYEGLEHSSNYGTSLNQQRGGAHTKSLSKTKGGGGGVSETFTTNRSTAKAIGRSDTRTNTETRGRSKSVQIGNGIAESFHIKPLLEPHEINAYLSALSEDEIDHPAYPGLMLVRIAGEAPFFVRRSNYDQDPVFDRCFSADPLHGFLPRDQQPLLGFQYTPEHIGDLRMPMKLVKAGFDATPQIRALAKFEEETTLATVSRPDEFEAHPIAVPFAGRIISIADSEAFTENGTIFRLKSTHPYTEAERRDIEHSALLHLLEPLEREERERLANIERKEKERLANIKRAENLKREKARKLNQDSERKAQLKQIIISSSVAYLIFAVFLFAIKVGVIDESMRKSFSSAASERLNTALFKYSIFFPATTTRNAGYLSVFDTSECNKSPSQIKDYRSKYRYTPEKIRKINWRYFEEGKTYSKRYIENDFLKRFHNMSDHMLYSFYTNEKCVIMAADLFYSNYASYHNASISSDRAKTTTTIFLIIILIGIPIYFRKQIMSVLDEWSDLNS